MDADRIVCCLLSMVYLLKYSEELFLPWDIGRDITRTTTRKYVFEVKVVCVMLGQINGIALRLLGDLGSYRVWQSHQPEVFSKLTGLENPLSGLF